MTRDELSRQPCPMGGTHKLTQPIYWVGASCRDCHRTWEGTGLAPTWPDFPTDHSPDDGGARAATKSDA